MPIAKTSKTFKKWFGSKTIIYSLEELIRIENSLNNLTYKEVPIGGLFASSLYPGLFLSKYRMNVFTLLQKYIQFGKYYILPLFNLIPFNIPNKNFTYLFNYSANSPRLVNFFLPLTRLIPDKKEILFVNRKGHSIADNRMSTFESKRLNLYNYWSWLIEFLPIFRNFSKLEQSLMKNHHLDWQILLGLRITLLHQSQSLFIFNKLLQRTNPKVIITDHDRQTLNAALIIQGKILQIPTYTFIHGGTIPIANFVPLVADKILCWGKLHQNQFHEFGIPINRLPIVGNCQLEIPETIPPNKTNQVVFVANPLEKQDKLKLATYFCEAVVNVNKTRPIQGIIKLHPSETISDYQFLGKMYPTIKILTSKEISNADTFLQTDLFVSHNSTMGFEALIKNKKVIILNPADVFFHIGIGKEMIEKGGCLEAKNSSELSRCILSEIKNIEEQIPNTKAAEYIDAYCSYFGEDSAKKVFELINQHS